MRNKEQVLEELRSGGKIIFKVVNFKGNHEPESLQALEMIVNTISPPGQNYVNTLPIPFGLYLGDVLVKNLESAEWVIPEEELKKDKDIDVSQFKISFKNPTGSICHLYPFRRAYKFFEDRTDSLHAAYVFSERVESGFLDPQKLAGKGQVDIGDNTTVEAVEAEKFEDED